MARPKELVKRDERVVFRTTPLEKKAIELMAEKAGVSLSDWVRKSAMDKTVHIRFSDEELKVYRDLQKFHNNFASIGNLFKNSKEVSPQMIKEVEEVKNQIKEELKRFQK